MEWEGDGIGKGEKRDSLRYVQIYPSFNRLYG